MSAPYSEMRQCFITALFCHYHRIHGVNFLRFATSAELQIPFDVHNSKQFNAW